MHWMAALLLCADASNFTTVADAAASVAAAVVQLDIQCD
jgi:hypothetical protein